MSTVDLDAIRQRYDWFAANRVQLEESPGSVSAYGAAASSMNCAQDVPALLAEVDRLRAVLAEDDPRHVVEFRATGWTVSHPLSCKSQDLFSCPVNRAAERDLVEAPGALGRFYCDVRDGQFVVTDLVSRRATAGDGDG